MVYQKHITIETTGVKDLNNITNEVTNIVTNSGIKTGLVHIFNIGSTGCIGAMEFEPGLEKDIITILDKLIPPSSSYKHELTWHDGNGHSHLQATILGPELTVPITKGQPVLGVWQQIFHLECDIKPHTRNIMITVMGE